MFKNLLLNNFNVTICNMIRQASSDSVDSKFLKHGFGPILGPQKGLLKANKNISIREYVFFSRITILVITMKTSSENGNLKNVTPKQYWGYKEAQSST